jgi:hypothetical protein
VWRRHLPHHVIQGDGPMVCRVVKVYNMMTVIVFKKNVSCASQEVDLGWSVTPKLLDT